MLGRQSSFNFLLRWEMVVPYLCLQRIAWKPSYKELNGRDLTTVDLYCIHSWYMTYRCHCHPAPTGARIIRSVSLTINGCETYPIRRSYCKMICGYELATFLWQLIFRGFSVELNDASITSQCPLIYAMPLQGKLNSKKPFRAVNFLVKLISMHTWMHHNSPWGNGMIAVWNWYKQMRAKIHGCKLIHYFVLKRNSGHPQ